MIHPVIDSLIVDDTGVVKMSKLNACKDISTICTSNISAIPCFVIHCKGKKELVQVASLVSCDCFVALPHDGMGWSAVCDCVIS